MLWDDSIAIQRPARLPVRYLQQQSHGAVVDQLDLHVGPENARFDGRSELPQRGRKCLDQRLGVLRAGPPRPTTAAGPCGVSP